MNDIVLDHNIILHKIDHYGIKRVGKNVFESYITIRQQCIQIKYIWSNIITTNIGVQHGSVLDPLL